MVDVDFSPRLDFGASRSEGKACWSSYRGRLLGVMERTRRERVSELLGVCTGITSNLPIIRPARRSYPGATLLESAKVQTWTSVHGPRWILCGPRWMCA